MVPLWLIGFMTCFTQHAKPSSLIYAIHQRHFSLPEILQPIVLALLISFTGLTIIYRASQGQDPYFQSLLLLEHPITEM